MRVAHISDLHVLSLDDAPWYRFLNKRLSGYANLRFRRHAVHREHHLRAVLRGVRDANVDHIVITGDLTNLALESEFERARAIITEELPMAPENISIIPGNHDVYTGGSQRSHRFASYFQNYATTDLSGIDVEVAAGQFPFVRLRGPLAIVGLSSAVSRPPMVAAGVLGKHQRDALAKLLIHPALESRTPVVLLHHPPRNPASRIKAIVEGLHDAQALTGILRQRSSGIVLHGHLHRRIQHTLDAGTSNRGWHSFGATSASLHHDNSDRMAGFNLYEFDANGSLMRAEGRVLDPEHSTFTAREIPDFVVHP